MRQGADGLKLTNMAGSACLRAEPNRSLPKLLAVPLGLSVREQETTALLAAVGPASCPDQLSIPQPHMGLFLTRNSGAAAALADVMLGAG